MSMQYSSLLDAETWAFVRKTAECYPDDTIEFSIDRQRDIYDEMCLRFHQGRPEGVSVMDTQVGSVPVRLYETGMPIRTVVYMHGGGFVVGGLDSHDDVCAEICLATGFRVVAVDYRLSPEHHHPAAFEDCWEVVTWARAFFQGGLMLVGDSAGGTLAAAVSHHARGRLDGILGQVLIYPGLGGDPDSGSYLEHAQAPMLTRDDVLFYKDIRQNGKDASADPTYAPLADRRFDDLPPTVVVSADCDPLRDDGRAYCARVLAAGGNAHWINEQGLVHGYLRARNSVKRARASFERITGAISALGLGRWPYD